MNPFLRYLADKNSAHTHTDRQTDRHTPMTTRPCGLRRAGKESIFESLRYSSTAYLAAFAGTKLHCLATEVTGFARLHEIFLRSAAVAAIENSTSMQTKIRRPAATLLANDIFKRSYLRENKSVWLHMPVYEMTYTVSSGTLYTIGMIGYTFTNIATCNIRQLKTDFYLDEQHNKLTEQHNVRFIIGNLVVKH